MVKRARIRSLSEELNQEDQERIGEQEKKVERRLGRQDTDYTPYQVNWLDVKKVYYKLE